ncbi:hypothetical protein [Amycolatopsis cihanbeyliensis]|uniref:Uncharacterized protein n=1 Tax=Amycolatopsis cihanbeyliensis TaxID=1128664 RepID=A0A542DFN1_AMYCI|nr:hypothetical protein [Amycolatopsis cihanbeyliensis]TQJ01897.1 hypothetical protein FB471_1613 [Amycolatopsis cihanbeyliensis]
MNEERRRFVVLLRAVGWQLHDVAFATMRGNCPQQVRDELADALSDLIPLLREDDPPPMIEHDRR